MSLLRHRTLTAREIEARRRNAQKSTGPRTARGKARVSLNGLKHGRRSASFNRFLRRLGFRPHLFHKLCGLIRIAGETQDPLSAVCMEAWLNLERRRWRAPDALTPKAGIKLNQKELENSCMDLPIPDLDSVVDAISGGWAAPFGSSRPSSRRLAAEIPKTPE